MVLAYSVRNDSHSGEYTKRGERLYAEQNCLRPRAWLSSAPTGRTDESKLACGMERSASTLSSALRCLPSANDRGMRPRSWESASSYNFGTAFASLQRAGQEVFKVRAKRIVVFDSLVASCEPTISGEHLL